MGWKHLTGQIPPTYRENVELHELRLALLSIHYGILQNEVESAESLDDKIEQIWQEHSGLKNVGMRYEVQVELVPDILDIFETFRKVDLQLNSVNEMDLLKEDYEETLRAGRLYPEKADFIAKKREAQEVLIRHFEPTAPIPAKSLPWDNTEKKEWSDDLDSFGFNGKGVAEDVYSAIRQHQRRNMVRSFLIKQNLGYSVLALKTSIPNAGRGIFLDGTARPGSILAFFPGQVWPREYLLNPTPEVLEHFSFARNPNFQVHFRGDDFVIDCRTSPYTVLENPWAVGHIANHAPHTKSNVRAIGINFFEKMQLGPNLWRYVPNEYAKPPTMMGGSILDRDVIEMHGMCLLNKRKALCNQEILFDYRFPWAQDDLPDWYTQVEYDMSALVEYYG